MNTLGNKRSRPQTIGNKIVLSYVIGHKINPKSHVLGLLEQTPTGEIVNYSNHPNQAYDPIKGNEYKEPPRKNGLERK